MLPLHHNSRKKLSHRDRLRERIDLWLVMQDLNPDGFRKAPTSRKNPKTHFTTPQTPLEVMFAQQA